MDREYEVLKKFTKSIKTTNRYFVDKDIIDCLKSVIFNKTFELKKGEKYYRGRIRDDIQKPYEVVDMMMPNSTIKSLGRFNSYGINHFYLATDIETVVSELRPNARTKIEIAEFELTEDIKIVNLTDKHAISDYSADFNLSSFILLLGGMFSRSFSKVESSFDYLPMQYFAELIKSEGLGGVLYFSSLFDQNPEKCNLTLFSDQIVKCNSIKTVEIKSIKYQII
ncbi:RES family NAD+ phosphorylase [Helicovermis profundi]|uniref:RES domain-containing protein n=1 Tax=Helicovermis profundi TaxID=3065157 RepID=A0AAU9E720_9FIRM|nr:hypothetical protein HLPR_15190 [Clostridia bacterium S502]BEP29197.1 hypothetical protein HLPR_15280 [Clostridia bacterium S502]